MQAHAKEHHALAKALMEHETLDAAQVQRVIDGKPPLADGDKKSSKPPAPSAVAHQVASKLPKVTAKGGLGGLPLSADKRPS